MRTYENFIENFKEYFKDGIAINRFDAIYYARFMDDFELSTKEVLAEMHNSDTDIITSIFQLILNYLKEIINELESKKIRLMLTRAINLICIDANGYTNHGHFVHDCISNKEHLKKQMCPNNLQYLYTFLKWVNYPYALK